LPRLSDSQDQFGNYAGDVAQEAVLPGEDSCVEGGGQQDVARRSATTDGSLTGNPLERSWQAVWQPEPTESGAGRITEFVRPVGRQQPKLSV